MRVLLSQAGEGARRRLGPNGENARLVSGGEAGTRHPLNGCAGNDSVSDT